MIALIALAASLPAGVALGWYLRSVNAWCPQCGDGLACTGCGGGPSWTAPGRIQRRAR
jgi:hypothetical protein